LSEKAWSANWRATYVVLALIALLVPSIVAGCRDLTVGVDTSFYMEPGFRVARSSITYESFCDKIYFEPLYSLLTYGIASCTDNVVWLLFFQQFIIISLVYSSACKLKRYAPVCLCMTIYFLSFFWFGLNGVRQTMAMAVCLLSFAFLLNRQFLKSIFLFLPALGFHSTAFIYLIVYPIYYLANKQAVNTLRLLEIAGIVATVLLMYNIEDVIIFCISIDLLPEKIMFFAPSRRYIEGDFRHSNFIYFGLTFLILQYARRKNYDLKLSLLFGTLILICALLSPASVFVSAFADRCMLYFFFLFIVFLPMILYGNNNKCLSPTLLSLLVIFLLAYWYKTIALSSGDTFPYTSEILGV
jgi:hypothetical protein